MICKVEDIVRDVRVALDRNNDGGRLLDFGDTDTLSLDEVIRSKVEEGARRALSEAPSHQLDSGHNFGDAVYWGAGGSGWVLLPDDFMRLVSFRMSDWERSVRTAMTPDDPRYAKLSSRYRGIRGNPQRPVCAVVVRPEGKALEFHSCRSGNAEVAEGVYLPYPRVDRGDGIEICRRCHTAVIYTIAGLVKATYGDTQGAELMNGLAQSALQ